MKKKELLTVLGVACIAVMSLSTLVYAATWTPKQMADWMYRVGKPKIWKILRNTNEMRAEIDDIQDEMGHEIKPTVEDVQDKMGQGLVGESGYGYKKIGITSSILWHYEVPDGNPKKVTFWVDLSDMKDGNRLWIFVQYVITGDIRISPEDTSSRRFTWLFDDAQGGCELKLIVDQLPVAKKLYIRTIGSGEAFGVSYLHIIEEL